MKNSFFIPILICLSSACGTNKSDDASAFPSKPIKIYVGFQPGGGTDMIARAVATYAQECLGQPVIVVNMPGASSILAANKVAKSKPDGYTLLIAGGSETVSVGHYRKLPYDPFRDFSPIIRLTVEKIVLTVNPASSFKTLDEFVLESRKQPAKFKYSSSGQFGIFHSTALAFCSEAGIAMKHVPYNGDAPSIAALMGNHIDLSLTSPVAVASLFKNGQVLCLAQCSMGNRSYLLPGVPTLKELGYNINIENQKGLVVPANTPKERIQVLHDCFKQVLENSDFIDIAKKMQLEVAYLGPEEFKASLQSVYDEIGIILKKEN